MSLDLQSNVLPLYHLCPLWYSVFNISYAQKKSNNSIIFNSRIFPAVESQCQTEVGYPATNKWRTDRRKDWQTGRQESHLSLHVSVVLHCKSAATDSSVTNTGWSVLWLSLIRYKLQWSPWMEFRNEFICLIIAKLHPALFLLWLSVWQCFPSVFIAVLQE